MYNVYEKNVAALSALKAEEPQDEFLARLRDSSERIDKHVGERLRGRRTDLGFSQAAVADRLGVTFQQVQKYELGMNRVSASRLYDLCGVFDVNIEYFFEGLDADLYDNEGLDLNDPQLVELLNHYMQIPEQTVRARLSAILRAVGRWLG